MVYFNFQNIVHCDLKPENVLLSSDSDFPQVSQQTDNVSGDGHYNLKKKRVMERKLSSGFCRILTE